jgi:hypothetical protein
MLTIAICVLAVIAFLILVMLWYINENLARLVNTLNRMAEHSEWLAMFAKGFGEKFVERSRELDSRL